MNMPLPDVLWLWGPGVFILLLGYLMFSALAKYVGKHFIEEFLDSQRRQASAIEGLCKTIAEQRHADDISSREIIYNVKLVHQDVDRLRSEIESLSVWNPKVGGHGNVEKSMGAKE